MSHVLSNRKSFFLVTGATTTGLGLMVDVRHLSTATVRLPQYDSISSSSSRSGSSRTHEARVSVAVRSACRSNPCTLSLYGYIHIRCTRTYPVLVFFTCFLLPTSEVGILFSRRKTYSTNMSCPTSKGFSWQVPQLPETRFAGIISENIRKIWKGVTSDDTTNKNRMPCFRDRYPSLLAGIRQRGHRGVLTTCMHGQYITYHVRYKTSKFEMMLVR